MRASISTNTLAQVAEAWIRAKSAEAEAVANRRTIEDAMLSLIGIGEAQDGTTNAEAPGGYKIKIVSRINRTVDADLVQELAAAAGLSDHLPALFRWKPELNKSQWDHAAESIRLALAPAITEKPGRPSFSITKE